MKKPSQRNAGSRSPPGDSPVSETPSSPGPRGWSESLGKAEMNTDVVISTERRRLDAEFVVSALQSTYWASNRSREDILSSIERSLCFGAFDRASGRQVGFARVVTDGVTFSWVCDVFVDPACRGSGIGKRLVSEIVSHPEVKKTNAYLGTKDAHSLYERFNFKRWELMRRDTKAAQL